MLGDADLDGRLSLDEYRDFLRAARPRIKAAGGSDRADSTAGTTRIATGFHFSWWNTASRSCGGPGDAPAKPDVHRRRRPPGCVRLKEEDSIAPEQERFFEAKIRPVLVTHCGKCHASTARKATGRGSVSTTREGLRLLGGDSGPARSSPASPMREPASSAQDPLPRRRRPPDAPPRGSSPDAVVADFGGRWFLDGHPRDPRTGPGLGRLAGAARRPGSREGSGVLGVPATEEVQLRPRWLRAPGMAAASAISTPRFLLPAARSPRTCPGRRRRLL